MRSATSSPLLNAVGSRRAAWRIITSVGQKKKSKGNEEQAGWANEFCAREASQLFGGSSIVKEGRGKLVERMYREVRTVAIPGGSEETLLAQVGKSVFKKARKMLDRQRKERSGGASRARL